MRCLVVKTGAFGDCLRITSIVHTLSDLKYNIDIFTSTAGEIIFKNNPFVNKIYKVKHTRNFIEMFLIIRKIRKNNYDLIINFETAERIVKAISELNFKRYIDFKQINVDEKLNIYDYNYKFIELITDNFRKYKYEIYPTKLDIDKVNKFLDIYKDKKKISIHIGSSKTNRFLKNKYDLRLWQFEKYVELIDYLLKENFVVFLTGSKNEKTINEEIIKKLQIKNDFIVDTAGKFNLQELYYFLANNDLFISGDVGVAHIAAAANVKQICLCGATDGSISAPPSRQNYFLIQKNPIDCPPCYGIDKSRQKKCKTNKCMNNINVKDIITVLSNNI